MQTVIAIFFCKSAFFIGQHFCKVEPLHLAFESDFVQFLVDCQNLFVEKIVQNISYDIMSKNISDMLKFNIVPEQTTLNPIE